jgi:iron complex outermembrane recepter protein
MECATHIKKLTIPMILFTVLLLLVSSRPAAVADDDLSGLSLDALLDVDVVTASKVPVKMTKTPAAIFVITGEDLRRSGANSIPEALRMVPGLHVYRIDANKWAISSRGFASRFANKILVMIDGRSVYTPLSSGVYLDVQDTLLADVERIEVIRGPGSSLWGANAVIGIINIITKDSADTQGNLITATAGTADKGTLEARHGGWFNETTSYRFYGKFFDRSEFETASGNDAADDYHVGRGGFRMDTNLSGGDKLTFQGDLYDGKAGITRTRFTLAPPFSQQFEEDSEILGGNLMGLWSHTLSEDSDIRLQLYYDRTERSETHLSEILDTIDADFLHRMELNEQHQLIWGLGYRFTRDKTEATADPFTDLIPYRLNPEKREDNLFSGFIQDRISLRDGQYEITLGTKFEYNDYSGFEWQPSLRLLWNLADHSVFWAAVTRSVRSPSRTEHDAEWNPAAFPGKRGITVMRMRSNDDIEAKNAWSYELGYRSRLSETVFVDISGFYVRYRDITSTVYDNRGRLVEMDSYGVEVSGNWMAADWWRLSSSLTWFDCDKQENETFDPRAGFGEDQHAEWQASLISHMDLPGNVEINGAYYYVDDLSALGIDRYHRFDLNLVWAPSDHFSITLGGRNLLDGSHPENDSSTDGIVGSEIPRNLYGSVSWNF